MTEEEAARKMNLKPVTIYSLVPRIRKLENDNDKYPFLQKFSNRTSYSLIKANIRTEEDFEEFMVSVSKGDIEAGRGWGLKTTEEIREKTGAPLYQKGKMLFVKRNPYIELMSGQEGEIVS